MASVIAVVRLAPGRVGYFDDITRIHLTIANPEKPVIEGMNVTNLKRAVRGGSIKVVAGSLEPVATLSKEVIEPIQIPAPVVPIVEGPAEVITAKIERAVEVPVVSEPAAVEESEKIEEPAKVEEPAAVEEAVIAPEIVEEVISEPAEEAVKEVAEEAIKEVEAPKAKTSRKKKTE
jgi:hypothetical protein